MIDIDQTLARGGAGRVDLLRYCVMSVTMEPVFLFLAGEYRLRPTHVGALALFDVFCAPHSPARLAAHDLLPPRDLGLASEITHVRERWTAMHAPAAIDESEEESRTAAPSPSRTLFDALARGVRSDSTGRLQTLSAAYDPQRTPQENLAGGKMNPAQRQFVERVWTPIVRPHLASAGFWQITSIG